MPRFGTSLPGVQQIPARAQAWERDVGGPHILEAARAAERAGFDWVSCSDHVAVPVSRAAAMGAAWFDAGSTLAFVAGATTHIRLLSHVLVLPYRHPLVVAKQYGTLDRLSGGRVILGVGSGHLKPEFTVLGADFARRGALTDEYLAAIAAAWTEEVASFAGETLAFRDVIVAPRPAQRPRPPIWVGGNSRAAVRRAARLADGWVPWRGSGPAGGLRDRGPARRSGRRDGRCAGGRRRALARGGCHRLSRRDGGPRPRRASRPPRVVRARGDPPGRVSRAPAQRVPGSRPPVYFAPTYYTHCHRHHGHHHGWYKHHRDWD